MNHKITFAKVAAMQYVTTPEGEKLCAIYINKNRIDFNPLHKVKDISNTLPDEVKRAVCKRFFFVFSLPVEERGIIASLPDISI